MGEGGAGEERGSAALFLKHPLGSLFSFLLSLSLSMMMIIVPTIIIIIIIIIILIILVSLAHTSVF